MFLGDRSEVQEGLHGSLIFAGANLKTQPLRDDLHGQVVRQHFRRHLAQLFILGDLDHAAERFISQAKFLIVI
jgi:hypothetical protein